MIRRSAFAAVFACSLILITSLSAQTVIATLPAGRNPGAIATDTATHKTYVVNQCGDDPSCSSSGTVTVVDDATLTTTTVPVGAYGVRGVPSIAIDHAKNKIYVPSCGVDSNCLSNGVLTIIDGTTLVTTSVPIGILPQSVAVNEVTNKIYVVNACGTSPQCNGNQMLSVIDGTTLALTPVELGSGSFLYDVVIHSKVAVDAQRNRIYVTNPSCPSWGCLVRGSISVIDGATLFGNTVPVGEGPFSLAINGVTNKIYVSNGGPDDSSITVIDGATLSTQLVHLNRDFTGDVAVNPVTNKVFVGQATSVSIIDGVTLAVTPWFPSHFPRVIVDSGRNEIYAPATQGNNLVAADGNTLAIARLPLGGTGVDAALDQPANRLYVANGCADGSDCTYGSPGSITVIDSTPPSPLQLIPVPACRLADTRTIGQPIQGGTSQEFHVPDLGGCGIPANAGAYSFNVTMVPKDAQYVGFLSIYPTGGAQPTVSLMNSWDGRFKANAAIVPAGTDGSVSVFASNTTDVVLDINGYFKTPDGSTLAFYRLPPCRVADTRWQNGHLGGPYLHAGQPRDLPVLESNCGIPGTARAYSLNFTAVPRRGTLSYFVAWPTGQPRPATSTLNAPTGTVVANAAVLPSGSSGDIDVFSTDDADLVVDVNGYFAPPDGAGLSLYNVPPCRVLDTRKLGSRQPFSGLLPYPVNVAGSTCGISSAGQAFVSNATVIPVDVPLGYLTLWPDGQQRPTSSTLNALDKAVTSNMAIVPGEYGRIDAYASGTTHMILDVSGYFAP
jgi:DNA-binding beta-propeller fold protein YncE